jgi:hypothetical protein
MPKKGLQQIRHPSSKVMGWLGLEVEADPKIYGFVSRGGERK